MAPGLKSQAKGRRAFCNWDEDTITMAVEAGLGLDLVNNLNVSALTLASTTMPFDDLKSSAIVARALGLRDEIRTLDLGYSRNAPVSGLIAALKQNTPMLFIASDRPQAKPATGEEMIYGAGAAAVSIGDNDVIAEVLGSASINTMFVDHFRARGESNDYSWEERWVRDEGYLKLVATAVESALANADIAAKDVNHFILATPLKQVSTAVVKKLGIDPATEADSLLQDSGFAGAAHSLVMLAHTLEKAAPDEVIVLAGFGQGADVLVLKTTAAIGGFQSQRPVSAALKNYISEDAYLRFATHEGKFHPDFGMRAERAIKTAFTEQYRSSNQLTSFHGGKCGRCATIQFPQLPYCVNPECSAPKAEFQPYPLREEAAKIATYTTDWLSYHPNPPLYVGFVQFDNGARLQMEFADIQGDEIEVGTPVKMVFRIKDKDNQRGYPRYFWKATPVRS